MSKDNAFFIEEYKALRQEISAKLKDQLEFNRWGLIGIAALYSYILSHPGKPVLFWIPVFLSMAMLAHLNEEHRMVGVTATYIKEQIEPWFVGTPRSGKQEPWPFFQFAQPPKGWETYLRGTKTPRWWFFWRRWPWAMWDWAPVPLWILVFGFTLIIAIAVHVWPSLIEPRGSYPS